MAAEEYAAEEPRDVVGFVSRVLGEALSAGGSEEEEEEGGASSMDAKISSVSLKLQILSAELTEEVERCMIEVSEAAPVAGEEATAIVKVLEGVSAEAGAVTHRAARAVEKNVAAQSLDALDVCKTNLRGAERLLRLWTEWPSLQEEAASGDCSFYGEKLKPAQIALSGLPDADKRERFCDELRDELEARLRPLIARPGDELTALVDSYEKLGLVDSFVRDFSASRPSQLHRKWFARPRSSESLAPWLATFLDEALALSRDSAEPFGDRADLVAAGVARAVFAPLSASFADRLDLCDVVDAAECRGLCVSFARRVSSEDVLNVVAGEPFARLNYLRKEADHLSRVSATNVDETQLLSWSSNVSSEPFFAELERASARCLALTGGLGATGLVKACSVASLVYCSAAGDAMRSLKARFVDAEGLPVASLLEDCWATAKRAFGAIAFAGKLETKLADRSASLDALVKEWARDLLDDERPAQTYAVECAKTRLKHDRRTRLLAEDLLAAGASPSPLDRVKLEKGLDDLNAAANSLVFELAFSPIRAALRRVSSTRSTAPRDDVAYCRPAAFCGQPPPDGPNEYVTVVGDHLMAALHELEPFLSGDAVRDALAARVDAAGRLTDGLEWSKLGDALRLSDGDRLGLRSLCAGRRLDGITLGDEAPDDDLRQVRDEEASQRFCTDWLECLLRATVAAFLDELCRLPAVDDNGSARLALDLAYLLNVANALDLPKHAILTHFHTLAAAPTKPDLDALLRRDLPDTLPAANVLRKIEVAFATARARGQLPQEGSS